MILLVVRPTRSDGRAPARSALAALAVTGAITAATLFGFAPRDEWGDPRVLVFLGLAGCALAGLLWAGGIAAAAVARRVGLPLHDLDAVLALAGAAVTSGMLWFFLTPLAHRWLPGLPDAVAVLALGAAGVAAYGLVRVALAAARVPRERVVLPWAALCCMPVLAAAVLASGLDATSALGKLPGIALGAVPFAAAVLLVARAPAWLRLAATTATVATALVVLRLLTLNPYERAHVAPAPASPASGPSVLFIVLDTFRADALDLSTGPESRTPNLARLAQRADVYVDAVANASWTLPGHASLFTGRYVAHHRVDVTPAPGFAPTLAADLPTAPRLFDRAGWATSCVVANGIVNLRSGLAGGCQRYTNPGRMWLQATLPMRLLALAGDSTAALSQLLLEGTGLNVNATGDEIVDRALREVEAGPGPLFLLLNFLDVHGPLPRPAADEPPPADARREHTLDQLRRFFGRIEESAVWDENAATIRAYYDAQVHVLDAELGRLFDALDARGWLDPALVVVTADHGEGFVENAELPGYFGHHSAYEPSVRIPLIVKHPGQRAGRVHLELAQQADVLPTLLAAAGLPPAPGVDGVDLAAAPEAAVVTEWYTRSDPGSFPFLPDDRRAIYEGPYKFVRDAAGREFLYDLSQSPYEQRDVLAERPETAARLRAALEAAIEPGAGARAAGADDPRLHEQLRALGYAE